MIIIYPTYYEKFKCIADKCPDTCCAGWQIVIDSETARFYENLKGSFGDKIRNNMLLDDEGDMVFVNKNGRCPFLNDKNLCDIFINVGEEHLSHTCTMFPRFYETFGSTREMGLSLSCPVANKLILSDTELDFVQEFSEELPEINELDADLYFCLKNERQKLLDFAKSNVDMAQKLSGVLEYADKLMRLLKAKKYDEVYGLELNENAERELKIDDDIFEKLEYLTENGRKTITGKKQYKNTYTKEYNNLLTYFIYRYFLKSIYNGKIYESLIFVVFSIKVISSLENNSNNLAEASRLFSKEIEHSNVNLNYIFENLY